MRRTSLALSLFAATLWAAASSAAPSCRACVDELEIGILHLTCLSQRMPDLLAQAETSDPLLVNLSGCGRRLSVDEEDVRSDPNIPTIPADPGIPTAHGSSGGSSDPAPAAPVFLFLSHAQLSCLSERLDALLAAAKDPTRFDFEQCRAE